MCLSRVAIRRSFLALQQMCSCCCVVVETPLSFEIHIIDSFCQVGDPDHSFGGSDGFGYSPQNEKRAPSSRVKAAIGLCSGHIHQASSGYRQCVAPFRVQGKIGFDQTNRDANSCESDLKSLSTGSYPSRLVKRQSNRNSCDRTREGVAFVSANSESVLAAMGE